PLFKPRPPDTTTLAPVNSGLSLFVNFWSSHSDIPTVEELGAFSELALPPLVAAASKDVPRTENTFTFSSLFTVHK
ncbi:hypothetical protein NL503_30135, partial [Klebsiella pneumoniae]|nr:hypothetical protein [Klebsiella pneumoniae]